MSESGALGEHQHPNKPTLTGSSYLASRVLVLNPAQNPNTEHASESDRGLRASSSMPHMSCVAATISTHDIA